MPTFNTTDPKPGFVYDTETDTWFPLLGIASQSLESLTDVVITSPSTSQILVYNGANWINGGETGDISAVTSGTGITVTNGTGPIPTIAIDTATTVDLSTSQTLDGLSDVVITSPATSQILVYDGTNWINGGETGDISAVTSGTGITVTNGTGPIPTIAVSDSLMAEIVMGIY